MERTIIRFLYGRPLETLLATFGVSLDPATVGALDLFGIEPVRCHAGLDEWVVASQRRVGDHLQPPLHRYLFTDRVSHSSAGDQAHTLGLDIRAVSQNRSMAKAMGIRTEWVDAMTFGLGSGIAGVAGVALSQLTNVGPNLGQAYIIDSFMVVVFGGVGNLWGSLIGGMSMGIVNNLLEPWAGAVLAKILVLAGADSLHSGRPRGLFPPDRARGGGQMMLFPFGWKAIHRAIDQAHTALLILMAVLAFACIGPFSI